MLSDKSSACSYKTNNQNYGSVEYGNKIEPKGWFGSVKPEDGVNVTNLKALTPMSMMYERSSSFVLGSLLSSLV